MSTSLQEFMAVEVTGGPEVLFHPGRQVSEVMGDREAHMGAMQHKFHLCAI